MKNKHIFLILIMFLFGIMSAPWEKLLTNEAANTIAGISLYVSICTLFLTSYITIENAVEAREYNKKKALSEYCARFSSNQNVNKVAEWLLAIAKYDNNEIRVFPQKKKDDKGNSIIEPTDFEKMTFGDFLVELNLQIKSKQLETEDVKKVFSLYIQLYDKVRQANVRTVSHLRDNSDYEELLEITK